MSGKNKKGSKTMEMKQLIKIAIGGFIALMALIMLMVNGYSIDQGERGLVLSFGKVTNVWSEGLHFKMPFRDEVKIVEVRTRAISVEAQAGSKDQQSVHTRVSVNYHLNESKVSDIYGKTGVDSSRIDAIIEPRIQDAVKSVTSKYNSDQLLSMREVLKDEVIQKLKQKLVGYHIELEATQITDFKFAPQYQQAIEAKQVAEQNALKAKNDLDRIKVESEQRIVQANAEAKAIQIQVEAIRTQGGAEYVQLKAIEKWNGVLPQYTGSNTPILNLK
jgi:regulator of protease activity HflC (stomatin/prohibitin superfamily)